MTHPVVQLAFYFDQSRCIGCYACVIACKDWHNVSAGPVSWRRMITIEEEKYPNPSVAFVTTSCFHCAAPSCMKACPINAISKIEEGGIVLVDRDICLGRGECGLCKDACPYDAPQFDDQEDAKMQKCNFCFDRWTKREKPICVGACPTRALDAGPIQDLKSKYGFNKDVKGFSYFQDLGPSVLFGSKS